MNDLLLNKTSLKILILLVTLTVVTIKTGMAADLKQTRTQLKGQLTREIRKIREAIEDVEVWTN